MFNLYRGRAELALPDVKRVEVRERAGSTSEIGTGDAAAARGLQMDLQEALDRARGKISSPDAGSPHTARKLVIVRLIAQGLANKEIADLVSICEWTLTAHLEQLRTQLGFRNRAQIATWAAQNGLISQTAGGRSKSRRRPVAAAARWMTRPRAERAG